MTPTGALLFADESKARAYVMAAEAGGIAESFAGC